MCLQNKKREIHALKRMVRLVRKRMVALKMVQQRKTKDRPEKETIEERKDNQKNFDIYL